MPGATVMIAPSAAALKASVMLLKALSDPTLIGSCSAAAALPDP